MKMQDLKGGSKPFFIFVILFEAIYTIVTIILGFPLMIIAHKIHMIKYYRNHRKACRRP